MVLGWDRAHPAPRWEQSMTAQFKPKRRETGTVNQWETRGLLFVTLSPNSAEHGWIERVAQSHKITRQDLVRQCIHFAMEASK